MDEIAIIEVIIAQRKFGFQYKERNFILFNPVVLLGIIGLYFSDIISYIFGKKLTIKKLIKINNIHLIRKSFSIFIITLVFPTRA